jgi:hypothetical protein
MTMNTYFSPNRHLHLAIAVMMLLTGSIGYAGYPDHGEHRSLREMTSVFKHETLQFSRATLEACHYPNSNQAYALRTIRRFKQCALDFHELAPSGIPSGQVFRALKPASILHEISHIISVIYIMTRDPFNDPFPRETEIPAPL